MRRSDNCRCEQVCTVSYVGPIGRCKDNCAQERRRRPYYLNSYSTPTPSTSSSPRSSSLSSGSECRVHSNGNHYCQQRDHTRHRRASTRNVHTASPVCRVLYQSRGTTSSATNWFLATHQCAASHCAATFSHNPHDSVRQRTVHGIMWICVGLAGGGQEDNPATGI